MIVWVNRIIIAMKMSVTLRSRKMRGFLAFYRVHQENKSDLSV